MKGRICVVVAVIATFGLVTRVAPLVIDWFTGSSLSSASLRKSASSAAERGLMPVAMNLWLPPPREMWAHTTHLIVVPGHAIFGGLDYRACTDPSLWFLEPHQRAAGPGFIDTLLKHIEMSVDLLEERLDESLLIFSGGPNHPAAGPLTEAGSYYQIARLILNQRQGGAITRASSSDLLARMVLDEYARDSLENVLFSICRFYEVVGRYPSRITVIGFEYKRERIEKVHRDALRWDPSKFTYIGLDSGTSSLGGRKAAAGTAQSLSDAKTLARARVDPYFASTENSMKVKALKNPQRRSVPYFLSCTDLRGLLNHRGPKFYEHSLPWKEQEGHPFRYL